MEPYDPGGTVSFRGVGDDGDHPAARLRSASGDGCGYLALGDVASYRCTDDCLCGGDCSVAGDYLLEGMRFGLPGLNGCSCTGEDEDDDDSDDSSEHQPAVSPSFTLSFDAPVVIFEDRHEDAPGVWVERRSTGTVLTIEAYGGEHGGSLSLSPSGFDRLEGDPLPLGPLNVPSGASIRHELGYIGKEASASENDIAISATFIETRRGVRSICRWRI